MIYESLEEVTARLGQSYVVYNGHLVYVDTIQPTRENGVFSCRAYPIEAFRPTGRIGDPPQIRFNTTDPLLNVQDIRLGYANTPTEALYIERMPTRRYKQGLDTGNTNIRRPRTERGNTAVNINTLRTYPGCLENMARNEYPTLEQVKVALNNDPQIASRAFHRCFALSRDHDLEIMVLQYKGRRVGHGDTSKLLIPPKYNYLRETLLTAGIQF